MTASDGTPTRPAGVLITVDGPGGVGKSTTTALAVDSLAAAGLPVHGTTQPSHTALGDLARHGTDIYHGMALACLCAADRHHQLATEIMPALGAGQIVVCDRYIASSLVLQGLDSIPAYVVWQLNTGIYRSDLAVLLNGDPMIIDARLRLRGGHSRFERDPNSSRNESTLYLRAEAELLAHGWPVTTLDATIDPADAIAARIVSDIHRLLAERSQACP